MVLVNFLRLTYSSHFVWPLSAYCILPFLSSLTTFCHPSSLCTSFCFFFIFLSHSPHLSSYLISSLSLFPLRPTILSPRLWPWTSSSTHHPHLDSPRKANYLFSSPSVTSYHISLFSHIDHFNIHIYWI